MTDLQVVANLDRIEQRVNVLLIQNSALKKNLDEATIQQGKLEADNKDLHKKLKDLQKNRTNQTNNFPNSQIFAKIVENKLSTEQVSELKETIDIYIKEIDRCIAQLSE